MALEDLIAQRIAATAASRRRLEESVYSLEPIRAGLSAAQNQSFQARSLINQKRGLELQEKEYAASQAGVPSVLAQPVAEGMVPETPVPVGADMPYGGSIAAADMAARVQRRGKIDAIVSALGARGGANLLAKLAAYTAMDRQAKEEATARLKEASALATYTRVLAGGGGAIRPGDDPDAAARGVDDYRQAGAQDIARKGQEQDEKEKQVEDEWWARNGPLVREGKVPDEAWSSAPKGIRNALLVQGRADVRGGEKQTDRLIKAAAARGEAPVFDAEGGLTGFEPTPDELRKREAVKRADSYLTLARDEKDRRKAGDSFRQALSVVRASWAPYRNLVTGQVDLMKWAAAESPTIRRLWDDIKAQAVESGINLRDLDSSIPEGAVQEPPPIPGGEAPPKTTEVKPLNELTDDELMEKAGIK